MKVKDLIAALSKLGEWAEADVIICIDGAPICAAYFELSGRVRYIPQVEALVLHTRRAPEAPSMTHEERLKLIYETPGIEFEFFHNLIIATEKKVKGQI